MRVAAYCRVSTDQADQANSFESQQRYFRDYIMGQPGWELWEIYADEGLSGTSTQGRAAFRRMIRDAEAGRFQLILTKEVSRFSRNILDTIAYTRRLRQLGVGVRFVNDGIDTLEPDAELRLSIMASIAQEESRKTSSRVKWGQMRRMEQGVVFGRSLLGYDLRDGALTVNPEGAEIVRLIFHKYVHEGKGTTVIARELREAGYKTLTGSTDWRNTVILKILRNEKYCGDLKQKKTFTPDYLTHRKQYNHGQEPFVFLRDHHEPIVPRGLWEAAQRELERRDIDGRLASGHGNRYPLSGKIRCGLCGKTFVSRSRSRGDGSRYRTWRCATATAEGGAHRDSAGHAVGCDIGYQLPDRVALELVRRSVQMLGLDRASMADRITRLVLEARERTRGEEHSQRRRLLGQREALQTKKIAALDAFLSGQLGADDLALMKGEYDRQLAALEQDLRAAEGRDHGPEDPALGEAELRARVSAILEGPSATDGFYGLLLDRITAFPGRRLEVGLKGVPGLWRFELETSGAAKSGGGEKVPD